MKRHNYRHHGYVINHSMTQVTTCCSTAHLWLAACAYAYAYDCACACVSALRLVTLLPTRPNYLPYKPKLLHSRKRALEETKTAVGFLLILHMLKEEKT